MPPTPNDRPGAPAPRRSSPLIPGGWLMLGLLLHVAVVLLMLDTTKSINYTEFERVAEAGQLKKLTLVGKDKGVGEVRNPDHEAVKALKLSGGKFAVKFPYSENQNELVSQSTVSDVNTSPPRIGRTSLGMSAERTISTLAVMAPKNRQPNVPWISTRVSPDR